MALGDGWVEQRKQVFHNRIDWTTCNMWTKLPDHGEARQGRLPVPVPMLEANIEALSEFSLTDDLKTSLQQSLKKNEKCYITGEKSCFSS